MKNFGKYTIKEHIEGFLEVFDHMNDEEIREHAEEEGMSHQNLNIKKVKVDLMIDLIPKHTEFTKEEVRKEILREFPELL